MYNLGDGVDRDYVQAIPWLRLAGDQGNAQAQLNLGNMYVRGLGTAKDLSEAAKWYKLAAAQGEANSQFALGVMHDNGQGVPKDELRAFMWLDLAAQKLKGAAGEQAVNNREIVARKLSAEQVAQAIEMTRQCAARKFQGCD